MLGYVCSYTVYSYTYTTMYSSMVCIVLTRQYNVIVTAAWPIGPSTWPVGQLLFYLCSMWCCACVYSHLHDNYYSSNRL